MTTRARRRSRGEEAPQPLRRRGVEAGERLIEQQQRRLVDQRPCDGGALQHPPAQLARGQAGLGGQRHVGQGRERRVARGTEPMQPRGEGEILGERQIVVEQGLR